MLWFTFLAAAFSVHRYFEHTTCRHAIDDVTDGVCHRIEVGAERCGDMNSGVANMPAAETRQSLIVVCEIAVLLKDNELSWQLTSGTRICELA